MKLIIDTDSRELTAQQDGAQRVLPLYSKQAFELISRQWLRVGWDQKYAYTFTWLGRPIIQLPEDMLRVQEVIYRVQPDVIIETGVAHGGSLVFYASLCKVSDRGFVIGIDLEIRPANRAAIEGHPLADRIKLIDGDSASPAVQSRVASLIPPGAKVLVVLDSCHTKAHVLAELEAFAPLVTSGSYLVATDGLMQYLDDVPRGNSSWAEDNPAAAARDFAERHAEFVLEQPAWTFNESPLSENVSHWPGAWLRRRTLMPVESESGNSR